MHLEYYLYQVHEYQVLYDMNTLMLPLVLHFDDRARERDERK